MNNFSQNKLSDTEPQLSKINFWSRMGLVFSILSIISTLLFLNIGGAPLSIFFGIFSISFVIISKNISGKLNKKNIISISLSVLGIFLGFLIFLLLLLVAYKLQDPAIANESLQRMRSIIETLEKAYNVDLGNFSGF